MRSISIHKSRTATSYVMPNTQASPMKDCGTKEKLNQKLIKTYDLTCCLHDKQQGGGGELGVGEWCN